MTIYFKVTLNTDKEDKYRLITTGLEIAERKPPNIVKDHERSTDYIAFFEELSFAMKYIGGLLEKIEEHEKQRISQ
jgi:hypothetical protein